MSEAGDGRAGRRERPTGDQVGGTWPVKREAADLLRRILDELPRSAADEGTLRSILEPLRSAADSLTAAGTQRREGESNLAGMADFLYVSPIVGFSNPIAPPFEFEIDAAAQVARGRGTFGRIHEGAPGIVHGGLLAAAIDELLGTATMFSGQPGMTGRLTVRYHHPTPILQELALTARLDRVEGRRLHLSCDVHAGNLRTASAEAVFIVVGDEKFTGLEDQRRLRERP